MKHDATSSPQPGLVLGHFGLAVLIFLISLPVLALTILVPPWLEVHCQRRQVLYWSERKKTYETSFAGFDFILASQKWSSVKTPPNPNSETLFDSREFDVFWPLLITEWVAIIGTAGACYYKLSRRVFQLPRHQKSAEQSHALEPAAGSVSNGASSPPAQ